MVDSLYILIIPSDAQKCTGLSNWPRHLLKNAASQHVSKVSNVFKTSLLKTRIKAEEFGEEYKLDIDLERKEYQSPHSCRLND